ncbi:hypothetical protein IMZ48_17270 [Candidatus Bathyarchaeota archaeon]|nr:hypothetical protein [Candidatus Bathyarchaeota archaeon]
MLRWCVPAENRWYNGEPDPDVPHTPCLLADEAPLRDDKLSTAEMNTVLWMSCAHRISREYQKHRIIPVSPLPTCTPRRNDDWRFL